MSRRLRVRTIDQARKAYNERDRSLDNDPDVPVLPPEMWENAIIVKYYRAMDHVG
jgi:hypothetical protein